MTDAPEPGQTAYEANATQFDIHPFFARAAAWADLPAETKAHYAMVERTVLGTARPNVSRQPDAVNALALQLERANVIGFDGLSAGLKTDIHRAVVAGLIQAGEAGQCWRLVERLRETEGASVTINAYNADFGGPNVAVEICAEWTNWETARFPGETTIDCLRAACRAAGIPGE